MVDLINTERIKEAIQETKRTELLFSVQTRFGSLASCLRSRKEERLPAVWRRVQGDLGQLSLDSEIYTHRHYLLHLIQRQPAIAEYVNEPDRLQHLTRGGRPGNFTLCLEELPILTLEGSVFGSSGYVRATSSPFNKNYAKRGRSKVNMQIRDELTP